MNERCSARNFPSCRLSCRPRAAAFSAFSPKAPKKSGTQIVFFDTPGILSKATYELQPLYAGLCETSVEGADAIFDCRGCAETRGKPKPEKQSPHNTPTQNQAGKNRQRKKAEERGAKASQTLMMRLQMRPKRWTSRLLLRLIKWMLWRQKLRLFVMDALMKLHFRQARCADFRTGKISMWMNFCSR